MPEGLCETASVIEPQVPADGADHVADLDHRRTAAERIELQLSIQPDNFCLLLRSRGGGVDFAGLHLLREVDEAPAPIESDIGGLVDGQGDHQVEVGDDPSNPDRIADLQGTEIETQERIYLDIDRPCHSRGGAVLDCKPDLCSAALEGAGKHRHESIDGDLLPWKQIENIADGRKGIFSASSAAGQGEGQGADQDPHLRGHQSRE